MLQHNIKEGGRSRLTKNSQESATNKSRAHFDECTRDTTVEINNSGRSSTVE